ncbi:MAG: hypothetical protein NTX82_02740 [Candidatus Parcubacteria bacterium]|nr:hypothetical protein [Candidatus Parcubacteria bacterium]
MLLRAVIIVGVIVILEILFRAIVINVIMFNRKLEQVLKRFEVYGIKKDNLQNMANQILSEVAGHENHMERAILMAYNILPVYATEEEKIVLIAVLSPLFLKKHSDMMAMVNAVYLLNDIDRAKLIAQLCYLGPPMAEKMWRNHLTINFRDPVLYREFIKELEALKN